MIKENQDKIIDLLSNSDVDGAIELIKVSPAIEELKYLGLPLMMAAVMMKHYNLVAAILSAGANPNILHRPDSMPNDYEDDHQLNVDERLFRDLKELGLKTPIHIAVNMESLDIVQLLLDGGADPNQTDLGLCTPLHWACMNGDLAMTKLLLSYGANPNALDLAASTPLHEAVRKNRLGITKLLLSFDAKSNIPDISGITALEAAKEKPQIYQELMFHTTTLEDVVYQS